MTYTMLLFSPHITPRLQYITAFIGHELLEAPFTLTSDREVFLRAEGPRLNYSDTPLTPDEFFLQPHPLLTQTGVTPPVIECFEYRGHKAFFATQGDFPFDIFAAAFYLISRYEEYLPHRKDVFGRYAHQESLAFREGFLDLPLVNIWLREFREVLTRKYPHLPLRHSSFKFIPTYDIDSAWSYLHKGWKRNLGGILHSLVKGRWALGIGRIQVLSGRRRDPFDAYEWLDSLHLYCRMRPYYFFLVAAHRKGVDKNISPDSPALQNLIRYQASGSRVGIHPSWQSGDEEALLKEEIEWLEYISETPITRSRQHYIRFTLPETYRRLIHHGIQQDFSMGYGSINGFRASCASSFFWYDLQKEETTGLRVFPFCFMDANSFYEQHCTAAQALTELLHYHQWVRKVGGLMITIWHNSFLGTDPLYAGWREVYEVFLKEEVYWDV